MPAQVPITSHSPLFQPIVDGRQRERCNSWPVSGENTTAHLTLKTVAAATRGSRRALQRSPQFLPNGFPMLALSYYSSPIPLASPTFTKSRPCCCHLDGGRLFSLIVSTNLKYKFSHSAPFTPLWMARQTACQSSSTSGGPTSAVSATFRKCHFVHPFLDRASGNFSLLKSDPTTLTASESSSLSRRFSRLVVVHLDEPPKLIHIFQPDLLLQTF